MTALDLSAIRAQLAGITPGEWTTKPFGPSDHVDDGLWIATEDDREVIVDMTTERGEDWEDQTRANIAFIAAAPSTVTRLLGIVERVEALAAAWEARGEHDMAYSKTIPDEDIATAILTDGAQKVENARHIRNAIKGTP